jgi:hypothetical protein
MSLHLDFYEADMVAFFLNLYRDEFREECKKFDDYSDEYIDEIITKISIHCFEEAGK